MKMYIHWISKKRKNDVVGQKQSKTREKWGRKWKCLGKFHNRSLFEVVIYGFVFHFFPLQFFTSSSVWIEPNKQKHFNLQKLRLCGRVGGCSSRALRKNWIVKRGQRRCEPFIVSQNYKFRVSCLLFQTSFIYAFICIHLGVNVWICIDLGESLAFFLKDGATR